MLYRVSFVEAAWGISEFPVREHQKKPCLLSLTGQMFRHNADKYRALPETESWL